MRNIVGNMEKMYQQLREHINTIVSFSEPELDDLLNLFELRRLKKGEHILTEGQVCTFILYVCSGCLLYYKPQDGKEITTGFTFENEWATVFSSLLYNVPSFISIKASEDTTVLSFEYSKLEQHANPAKLYHLESRLTEQAFVQMTNHCIDLQTLNASERYAKLLAEHPEILQRVSLYHIANYLGITPKSLSRIRKAIW